MNYFIYLFIKLRSIIVRTCRTFEHGALFEEKKLKENFHTYLKDVGFLERTWEHFNKSSRRGSVMKRRSNHERKPYRRM